MPCRERVGAKIRVKVFIALSLVTRWPAPRPLVHCYCPQGLDHDDDDNDDANNHNHDNGSGCNANQPYLCLLIMPVNQENNIFFCFITLAAGERNRCDILPPPCFWKEQGLLDDDDKGDHVTMTEGTWPPDPKTLSLWWNKGWAGLELGLDGHIGFLDPPHMAYCLFWDTTCRLGCYFVAVILPF